MLRGAKGTWPNKGTCGPETSTKGLGFRVSAFGVAVSDQRAQPEDRDRLRCHGVDEVVGQHEVDVAVNVRIWAEVLVVTAGVALANASGQLGEYCVHGFRARDLRR